MKYLLRVILLRDEIDRKKVCKKQTTLINKYATFVIDINLLKHPDDMKKDKFRRWCYNGSHLQAYLAWKSDDGYLYKKVDKSENRFLLRRINFSHPSNPRLTRLLAFVTGLIL